MKFSTPLSICLSKSLKEFPFTLITRLRKRKARINNGKPNLKFPLMTFNPQNKKTNKKTRTKIKRKRRVKKNKILKKIMKIGLILMINMVTMIIMMKMNIQNQILTGNKVHTQMRNNQ